MDRVWGLIMGLIFLMGLFLGLMQMDLGLQKEADVDHQDLYKLNEVCGLLAEDDRYLESISWGAFSALDYDEDALLQILQRVFKEELKQAVFLKEHYLRIYDGSVLGPPVFYRLRSQEGIHCFSRRSRECLYLQRDGKRELLTVSQKKHEEVISRIERMLGFGDVSMRAGVRILLSSANNPSRIRRHHIGLDK